MANVNNDIVKKLAWTGLLAAFGALASVFASRAAAVAYTRIFSEDPPE